MCCNICFVVLIISGNTQVSQFKDRQILSEQIGNFLTEGYRFIPSAVYQNLEAYVFLGYNILRIPNRDNLQENIAFLM